MHLIIPFALAGWIQEQVSGIIDHTFGIPFLLITWTLLQWIVSVGYRRAFLDESTAKAYRLAMKGYVLLIALEALAWNLIFK